MLLRQHPQLQRNLWVGTSKNIMYPWASSSSGSSSFACVFFEYRLHHWCLHNSIMPISFSSAWPDYCSSIHQVRILRCRCLPTVSPSSIAFNNDNERDFVESVGCRFNLKHSWRNATATEGAVKVYVNAKMKAIWRMLKRLQIAFILVFGNEISIGEIWSEFRLAGSHATKENYHIIPIPYWLYHHSFH